MNRRDFLKGAASLAVYGALARLAAQTGVDAFASAAKPSDPAKTAAAASKKITRRPYKKTSFTLPLLGLGMMRLPERDKKIDKEAAQKLVDTAMAAGLNYFDTARPYHNGASEAYVGEALKKYPRESYIVATKLPLWSAPKNISEVEDIFNSQLKNLQVDFIDFYLVHGLNASTFRTMENVKAYEFLKKQKAAGKIKYLGFSFHDSPEVLSRILAAHEWDFCQIQLNYVDWEKQNAKRQYEMLTEKGIPVIVMEPIQGGRLASLNQSAVDILKKADPAASPASWALRYAASLPNVITVLTGLTYMSHLKENIETFTDFKPLTDSERGTLDAARDAYLNIANRVGCTACHYCKCPVGIDIPTVFSAWNDFCNTKDQAAFKKAYNALAVKPDNCISCRQCTKICPQHLDIPAQFNKITAQAKKA